MTVVRNLRQARFSIDSSPTIHPYSSFLLNQLISSLPVMLAGMKNLPVGNPLCRHAFLKSHVQTPSIHGAISKWLFLEFCFECCLDGTNSISRYAIIGFLDFVTYVARGDHHHKLLSPSSCQMDQKPLAIPISVFACPTPALLSRELYPWLSRMPITERVIRPLPKWRETTRFPPRMERNGTMYLLCCPSRSIRSFALFHPIILTVLKINSSK